MTNKPQFVGERVRLGDIVTAASERNKNSHCNAVYSVTNSQGFIPSEDYFSKEVFSKDLKTYRVVRRNMIAYNPSRINVGSVALQDKEDEVVVSPLYVVFSADERKVLPDYLVRFLKSKPGLGQIAYQSIGTVRNNLKFNALCQIELRLPPLEIQQRRLFNLSSIHRQIDISSRRLFQLDSLVKSRFVEMFGDLTDDMMKPLKEVCSVITDGTHQPPKFENDGVPFLFVSNIASNSISYETNKFISMEDYQLLTKRTPIEIGDILVSAVGSFGHPAIVKDGKPFCFQRHIAYLKPIRKLIDSFYLHAALLSDDAQHYMDQCAKGVAQRTVTLKSFKEMRIPVPAVELQQEFAAFVAQVDKSRFAYIWNRTKSVRQTLSGPSSTLAIQHVEPQTRSKYWADASSPPFWLSVGAVLILKTPRVCVLIPTGQMGAICTRHLPGVMRGTDGSLLICCELKRKHVRFFGEGCDAMPAPPLVRPAPSPNIRLRARPKAQLSTTYILFETVVCQI